MLDNDWMNFALYELLWLCFPLPLDFRSHPRTASSVSNGSPLAANSHLRCFAFMDYAIMKEARCNLKFFKTTKLPTDTIICLSRELGKPLTCMLWLLPCPDRWNKYHHANPWERRYKFPGSNEPNWSFLSHYIYISKAFRTLFCCALRQTPSSRMSLCNYMREILYFTTTARSRWKTCKTQPCNCPLLVEWRGKRAREERQREGWDLVFLYILFTLWLTSLSFSPPSLCV